MQNAQVLFRSVDARTRTLLTHKDDVIPLMCTLQLHYWASLPQSILCRGLLILCADLVYYAWLQQAHETACSANQTPLHLAAAGPVSLLTLDNSVSGKGSLRDANHSCCCGS